MRRAMGFSPLSSCGRAGLSEPGSRPPAARGADTASGCHFPARRRAARSWRRLRRDRQAARRAWPPGCWPARSRAKGQGAAHGRKPRRWRPGSRQRPERRSDRATPRIPKGPKRAWKARRPKCRKSRPSAGKRRPGRPAPQALPLKTSVQAPWVAPSGCEIIGSSSASASSFSIARTRSSAENGLRM